MLSMCGGYTTGGGALFQYLRRLSPFDDSYSYVGIQTCRTQNSRDSFQKGRPLRRITEPVRLHQLRQIAGRDIREDDLITAPPCCGTEDDGDQPDIRLQKI